VGGAAAGAIVGRVIGRNRSTTVGAVTGAAVGAAVALSARDGHATIPVGALLTIRLTENLVLR
jgi:outer membrane lipoprotein SlyB